MRLSFQVACICALAAACSEPDGAPTTDSPAAVSNAPHVVQEVSGPSACGAATLSLEVVAQDAGAGSRFATLAFTNTGTTACVLDGYPDIALLDTAGQPRTPFRIEQTPVTTDLAPVTLSPGVQAWFDLVTTAVAGEVPGEKEPCPATTAVRAIIAGANVDAPIELNPCNQRARVSTIRATAEPEPAQ